ncbi:MAG: DUF2974 domain-containing protein [Clostridia bacterium]|nr:DUF2974 domain-containing protein [Clostridia bacterium]
MALLSSDDLYLLNLLFSTDPSIRDSEVRDCYTIEEAVATIEAGLPKNDSGRGSFDTTKSEMEWAINQIKANPELMQLEVATVDRDPYGVGTFVVKTPAGTVPREGVVVFEGSASAQDWKDNFQGGSGTTSADGVSTPLQEYHLNYYQQVKEKYLGDCDQITVTGHSKGGNKAKYITLLDGSVDRCVAFDGQGFSDEFIQKYQDEIALRQNKITNYNAKEDYVNILLNDVGKKYYIDGENRDNFLLNHSLYTMKDCLPLSQHCTAQSAGTKAMDKLVNSMLRSMPSNQRVSTLEMLGTLMACGTYSEGMSIEQLLRTLAQGSYASDAGYALAYIVKYMQVHPADFASVMEMLTNVNAAFASVVWLMWNNWTLFAALLHLSSMMAISAKIAELLCDLLGIDSTFARILADMMGQFTVTYLSTSTIADGSDKRVESVVQYTVDQMRVDIDALEEAIGRLGRLTGRIQELSGDVRSCAEQSEQEHIRIKLSLSLGMRPIRHAAANLLLRSLYGSPDIVLRNLAKALEEEATSTSELLTGLRHASQLLAQTEERNVNMCGTLESAALAVGTSTGV